MSKKFYVTTPIYYPNDKLHIGHAYTTTLADYISRYKKLQGYDVMFVTGSDEHGQKIQDKAREANQDTLDFVTNIVDGFKKLWKSMNIDYDIFIRTTDKIHENYVKKSFTEFMDLGFIYKDFYTDLYCKSDEAYFTKTQAPDGICPICGNKLELISEESYFLKISSFKNWIKDKLENSDILIPKHRTKELINNFVEELQDLSISRTSFDWGIKIDEDNKHVIYVWLDALQNYISALSYPNSKFSIDEVWNKNSDVELLQLVGKEITRFHSIYWPIILEIKNYREPKVLAHGWLVTDDGDKMSKSKGNVVDPNKLIDLYGSDALRFYLINNIVTSEDGRFSNDLLEETINSILVNKYSNLISRTDAMVKKYSDNIVPKFIDDNERIKLFERLSAIEGNYHKTMNKYDFSKSTKLIVNYIDELNGYIDITEPWKKDGQELDTILNTLITGIFNVNIILSSILINKTKKVFKWLSINSVVKFNDMNKDFSGVKLNNIEHLYERIKRN